MKNFIQKNLPFLSILIIATLFLTPFILAVEWTGRGDVSDFTGLGDVSGFTGLGDVSGFTGLGDVSGFTGLGDAPVSDIKDTAESQQPQEEARQGPADPIFFPDNTPPIDGDDIPPLDDVFEATIDLTLSDSPDPVQPGEELTYTITYYNRGHGDARDITITLDSDANAPIQSSKPSATSGNSEWRIEEVESKTGGTITIKTKVKDKTEASLTAKATITYHDPVYGTKTTSATEHTEISEEETQEEPDESIGIKILSTRFPLETTAREPVLLQIHIENDGTEHLEDTKITIINQELGIRASAGPFDLDAGSDKTKTVLMNMPADAPEGTYFLRFTVTSNSNTRRVVYREIDLVSTPE